MAKAKISSQDFLDLMDEQNDQAAPALGLFGKAPPTPFVPSPDSAIEPSSLKTGHKVDTNRTQTGDKLNTKPDTNRAQTGHAAVTQVESPKQTGHKVDTQPDTQLDTKWTQTAHKLDTKTGFSSLVGLQREMAIFVYRACQYARSQETDPLTLEHVSKSLKIRIGSVKTTLRRLEEKNILERIEFRNGRGGWSKYRLPEVIFREMLHLETGHKLDTNRAQTGHKVDTQPDTQPDTSLSSSSSSIDLQNLKTTTNEAELFKSDTLSLSPEWQQVDISPLASMGFTQSHLIQIIRQGKLSAVETQDSINFYAFDLNRNGLKPNSQLNFFMGIVRKGIPYAPPENYESPADEARRKIREFKERKERERLAEEKKIVSLEFSEWRRGLPTEEVEKLLPEYARKPGPLQDSALESYFEKNVWPERSQELLGLATFNRAEIAQQIEQSLAGEMK